MFIFSGNSRNNLTSLVELDQAVGVGAPYSIRLDDGAVVVVKVPTTTDPKAKIYGSFRMSY